jgi:hypothetical protein
MLRRNVSGRLTTASRKGYVPFVLFRRIILIICILALLPTAVDPSCIGYFMYSNDGLAVLLSPQEQGFSSDRSMASESDRPAEGLAATRIPSQVSIAPLSADDLWARFVAAFAAGGGPRHAVPSPDFLAPALRTTFLRNSVLLI